MKMLLGPVFKLIYNCYSRFIGATEFPITLDIELTNNCNLDCIMCSRNLMKRKIGYMNSELLKKIIAEVRLHPPKSIGLHLFGEPLMHSGLIGMIKMLKENIPGSNLLLSTNAYFLNQGISKDIIDSGLDRIRFSLDGVNSSTYEKIRRGSDFERVVSNIKGFLKVRKEANSSRPLIQMQIIGMKDTASEIRQFKRLWEPLLRKDDRLIIQEFVTFGGKVADRTRFRMASIRDRIKRRIPCLRLWKNLIIYLDGRVSICCYDYDGELLVGDLNKETISQIWKGEKLNALRLEQLNWNKAVFPLCRSCISQRY